MELKLDSETFDEHQMILIGEIIERTKNNLEDAGIKGEQLKEVVGNIAFSIATTLDNSSTTEFDGVVVNPYLGRTRLQSAVCALDDCDDCYHMD